MQFTPLGHLPGGQELFTPAGQQRRFRVGSEAQPRGRVARRQTLGPLHERVGARSVRQTHQRRSLRGASFVRAGGSQAPIAQKGRVKFFNMRRCPDEYQVLPRKTTGTFESIYY